MKKEKITDDEKGIVLVSVLLIIFFLSVIGISYLLISRTELSKSYKDERFTAALATSEAGLERAIWYLVNDSNLPNWTAPTPAIPKVTISGYLDKEGNRQKYYEAEIHLIIAPGGGRSKLPPKLPPRPKPGWYIHPAESNLPRPKGNSQAVTINGVVFMFGGYGQPTKSTDSKGRDSYKDDINYWGYRVAKYEDNSLLAYYPTTDSWVDLGKNPYGNKSKFAAVSYNNKMYMFGKDPNVYVYDPGNNLLSSTDDTWSNVANMENQLGISYSNYVSAVVLGDKIYVLGGEYTTTQRTEKYGLVLEFNPADNKFKELNPFPDGRYYGAAGVVKDKIYYLGGVPKTGMSMGKDPVTKEEVTTQSGNHTRTVWEYDPTADNGKGSCTPAAHIPWLEDNPDTQYCREDLAPGGGGDKIEGFNDSLKDIKTHVRDPEYSKYWKDEGYGVDHGVNFSNRPGLADHQVVMVDDKIYVIGGNNGHLRSYFDGPGFRDKKGEWHGTYISDNKEPDKIITSGTTGENVPQRDLFYDYKDGASYGSYDSYRDWQGALGSYARWNKELYVFDGTSWTRLESAPTMEMITNGGMQGVGITNHTLAAVDGRFYMLGGVAHHFRDPNRQYLNQYVVEGDDTSYGRAAKSYVNAMYLSPAEYYIRAEKDSGSNVGKYKIISTGREQVFDGTVHKIHRRIEAIVNISPMTGANGFDGAIICNTDITGSGNVQTDSYNSDNGKYGVGNNSNQGNIFSNGKISLTGNVLVDGNAFCGFEETVINLSGNAHITGKKDSLGNQITLPSVTIPADAIPTSINLNGNDTLILTDGIYTCSGIRISGNAQLIIHGNVKLYCTGNIDISGNGGANYENNQNGDTTNFHIYCTDSVNSISLTGNDRFFGTIYAPQAKIEIRGNGNVYGQVVVNEIDFSGNGKVIYDEKLKETMWWVTEGYKGDVISWREVRL